MLVSGGELIKPVFVWNIPTFVHRDSLTVTILLNAYFAEDNKEM